MDIKVILPAEQIPLESTVTKFNGSKPYTLKNKIRFYGDDKLKEVIASEGALFMVSAAGDVNAIPANLELIWLTDVDELSDWLSEEEGE